MSTISNERPLTHYAMLSIAAAVVTFFLKLAAWHFTGSVGLLSDALETLVNLVAAIFALFSLWVAARPADHDHAHGHTKVEYFSGGMEGALILLAAVGIGWTSMDRLFKPQPLSAVGVGIVISIVASFVNLAVARILFSVASKRHSVALEADAQHLMTDVWTSVVVVVAVALVPLTGWNRLDPILGLLLAVHIIFIGVKLVRQSMMGLMDAALPDEEMKMIREILERHAAEGMQYHALRTRVAGAQRFMSVHLLVPGAWTVARGHDLAERIEHEILQRVQRINVLTHIEPLEDPVSWDDVEIVRKEASAANDK